MMRRINSLFLKLPQTIDVQLLNEQWMIEYIACKEKLQIIQRPNRDVVVLGKIGSKENYRRTLVRWLMLQAKYHLVPFIKSISDSIDLPYERISIRNQISRWGSCSSAKSINLNYKLIFLPKNIVYHVMVHELCHLKFLNHSSKFWDLVASFDPDWKLHRKDLRLAHRFIPHWA